VAKNNVRSSAVQQRGLRTDDKVRETVTVEVSRGTDRPSRKALHVSPDNAEAHGAQEPQSHIRDRVGGETEYNITCASAGLPVGIRAISPYQYVSAAISIDIAYTFDAYACSVTSSSANNTQTSSSGNKGGHAHIAVRSRVSEYYISSPRVRARAVFESRADDHIVLAVVVEISRTAD
jgi:hypothetical protein